MKLPDIEWVWVDLDDTLWDFRENSRQLLGHIYKERGLDRWFPTTESWIESYEAYNQWLWREYAAARISREFLKADRFRKPLADAGCPTANEEGAFLDGHYLERLGTMKALVNGATEMLDYLRARGYKIGILSNGFAGVQHSKLRETGLDRMVDLVVLSDDIGVTKPDHRIFDHAAALAEVPASRCVMIGDNPQTDIAGALSAGWEAIYFDRSGRFDGSVTPKTVDKLWQIRYFL